MCYADYKNENDEVIEELARINMNAPDEIGDGLLSVMATTGRVALCKKLMEIGLSPDIHFGGYDSLQNCIAEVGRNSREMLATLLKGSKYSIKEQRGMGTTLLHCAVSWGKIDIAKFLISQGASMLDMDIDCFKVIDLEAPEDIKNELCNYEANRGFARVRYKNI